MEFLYAGVIRGVQGLGDVEARDGILAARMALASSLGGLISILVS